METKSKKIANGDLYALLSICTQEDLDPLVKCINKKLSNWLVIDEDYKKYSPDHTKYYRVIADEIRLFGGNTFVNLIRGAKGPSYDEVVLDVCKRFGIPCRAGETVQNEANFLTISLDRQWKRLSEREREEVVELARLDAAKKTGFNAKNAFVQAGPALLARYGAGPIGWGVGAFSLADPAFSVTAPCVLHVAYLRKKYMEGANLDSMKTSGVDKMPAVQVPVRSSALLVGDSEESPVLSLIPISEPEVSDWTPVNDDHEISRLNPLLQALPSLTAAGEMAGGQYMEVVINGPLLQAKGQDGYRLITMIDGKPSHGTLLDPGRLSTILNVSALFQVASVAVAQKHLADISRKLSEIKAGIERINDFQVEERRSVISGAIRYFELVAQSVLLGERSESVRREIESCEVKLIQAQDHIVSDIKKLNKEIPDLKDEDMFGSRGIEELLRKHQNLLKERYQDFLLCIRARACGWQLLAAYPGDNQLKEDRKQGIEESLGMLAEGSDLLCGTEVQMESRVRSISARSNRRVTLNQRKLGLLSEGEQLINDILEGSKVVAKDLKAAEVATAGKLQPVTMLIKVEDAKITASFAA